MARQQGRPTMHEKLHRKHPDVDALVKIWRDDMVQQMLTYVWEAYDYVYTNCLSNLSFENEDYEDLERSITEDLEGRLQDCIDRYLPYRVQHEASERESRKPAPASPPQYDIAFVWRANPRIMWPLEAKVVKTDQDNTSSNLGEYVKEVQDNFLTCRYAPFSNGGAMLCYFKSGNVTSLLNNIANRLGCTLSVYPCFHERPHRTSEHMRTVPEDKKGQYPAHFCCHHLIMPLF